MCGIHYESGSYVRIVHDMTLEEAFTRVMPDMSHLKVFGCVYYVHIPDEKTRKLGPKTEKCVFFNMSWERRVTYAIILLLGGFTSVGILCSMN